MPDDELPTTRPNCRTTCFRQPSRCSPSLPDDEPGQPRLCPPPRRHPKPRRITRAGAGRDAAAGLDGPLLSDTDELHASWQRIQGAFIDDPREAVADAAGLVEHVGAALAGALRQRQQQLRAMWDRDGMPDGVDYADSGSAPRPVPPRPPAGTGRRRLAAPTPSSCGC